MGAPTTVSLVRTIVTPRSRSAWSSVAPRRHSVIRLEMSELDARSAFEELELLRSVEVFAPVALVELLVAPMVLLDEVFG